MREYLATFYTHYGAACFARSLKEQGVPHRMMPVPRRLSSSCGVCVVFSWEGTPPADAEDLEAVYRTENETYTPVYRRE